jgi:hypothetical protein
MDQHLRRQTDRARADAEPTPPGGVFATLAEFVARARLLHVIAAAGLAVLLWAARLLADPPVRRSDVAMQFARADTARDSLAAEIAELRAYRLRREPIDARNDSIIGYVGCMMAAQADGVSPDACRYLRFATPPPAAGVATIRIPAGMARARGRPP